MANGNESEQTLSNYTEVEPKLKELTAPKSKSHGKLQC